MQLVDKNGSFKDWHTVKHEYDLQNNLYFQWMQLVNAIPSNWKNIVKQITISIRLRQHSIILFETQEFLRFKKQLQRSYIGYL